MDPFVLLHTAYYLEEVAGLGIAIRSEHAHEALWRLVSKSAKLLEANSCVYVVAQYDLASIDVSRKQTLDAFFQQTLAKDRVAPCAGLNGVFEITGEWHFSVPLALAPFVISPKLTGIFDVTLLEHKTITYPEVATARFLAANQDT